MKNKSTFKIDKKKRVTKKTITQNESECIKMKKVEKASNEVKRISKNNKKIYQKENIEYTLNKDFTVSCVFTNYKNDKYKYTISKNDSQELYKLRELSKRQEFYDYCNDVIKLNYNLHSNYEYSIKANKLCHCKNTQLDSRKRLQDIYIQYALSMLKEKVKKAVKNSKV